VLTPNFQKLFQLLILAATLNFSAPVQNPTKPLNVYYESSIINFSLESPDGKHPAALGPWNFGELLREDKPLDKRLNLYVLVPGTQYHSAARPEYDHSLVVNSLTHEKEREWDIYWCFILDSRLTTELHSEKELLAAAQQSFRPADLFDVEDIPAHEMLSEKTGVRSFEDLRQFRHKDGTLPRLLILPAHLAVRAMAGMPEEPEAPKEH
jgi:hypothetical protein